jgi:hypothetical protein
VKIELAYPYKTVSGMFKVALIHEPKEWRGEELEIHINEARYPLRIDGNYMKANSRVEFGINTYHCLSKPDGEISFYVQCGSRQTPQINVTASSDHDLWSKIRLEMLKLPCLVGLPLDFSTFESLQHQIVPLGSTAESSFLEDGFIVIPQLIDEDLRMRAIEELDDITLSGYRGYIEGDSARIEHLHMLDGAFTEIFESTAIRKELKRLYGVEMLPCQTLTYKYGSQQGVHSDFVHLSTYPVNLMCGVWIAFEDVAVGAGELSVYKGSHMAKYLTMSSFRLPKVRNGDYSKFRTTFDSEWSRIASETEEVKAFLRAGDVLVWQANLLHAGNPRLDNKLTRKSCVLHYFANGAPVYYDSTGDIGFSGRMNTSNRA